MSNTSAEKLRDFAIIKGPKGWLVRPATHQDINPVGRDGGRVVVIPAYDALEAAMLESQYTTVVLGTKIT